MNFSREHLPSLDDVTRLAADGHNLVPIHRELLADRLTPSMAFEALCGDEGDGFLLESVEGGERLGRYSFVAGSPRRTLVLDHGRATIAGDQVREFDFTDPAAVLREEMAGFRPAAVPGLNIRFTGGLVGYLGYEIAGHFEKLPRSGQRGVAAPDAALCLADTLVIFDHVTQRVKLVSHARLDGSEGDPARARDRAIDRIESMRERLRRPSAPRSGPPTAGGPFAANLSPEDFEALVARAREYILAGDIFQVVLSQRFSRPVSAQPFDVYRALRAINPSPYMYFLRVAGTEVLGTSPEILLRVEDGTIETRPLAGTRPRSADPERDRALEVELLGDEKERAEHVMLVDLARNDVGRVAEAGSVVVARLMEVERFSHVMHIMSEVRGRLRPGTDALDALAACFPAGTLSGAPKIRAMEVISELEPGERGPYGGALGYIGFGGSLDMAITLRTIVVAGGLIHVQAGAGIVADSDPTLEYRETLNKAAALFEAAELADAGFD